MSPNSWPTRSIRLNCKQWRSASPTSRFGWIRLVLRMSLELSSMWSLSSCLPRLRPSLWWYSFSDLSQPPFVSWSVLFSFPFLSFLNWNGNRTDQDTNGGCDKTESDYHDSDG